MNECEKLLELLINYGITWYPHKLADYLLRNGVVVKESGKWADAYMSDVKYHRCTECGEYVEDICFGAGEYKYCPYCGARMEGGE